MTKQSKNKLTWSKQTNKIMDYKKDKEELVNQFNQINLKINELLTLREQIRGQLIFIEKKEKKK